MVVTYYIKLFRTGADRCNGSRSSRRDKKQIKNTILRELLLIKALNNLVYMKCVLKEKAEILMQGWIQKPVKHLIWSVLLKPVNYFPRTFYLRCLTGF